MEMLTGSVPCKIQSNLPETNLSRTAWTQIQQSVQKSVDAPIICTALNLNYFIFGDYPELLLTVANSQLFFLFPQVQG